MKSKKSQSVLEYVIVLTAIIAALLVGIAQLALHQSSVGLGKLMNKSAERITNASADIANIVP